MPMIKVCKKCGKTKADKNYNPQEKCRDCGSEMEYRAEVKSAPLGWGHAIGVPPKKE